MVMQCFRTYNKSYNAQRGTEMAVEALRERPPSNL